MNTLVQHSRCGTWEHYAYDTVASTNDSAAALMASDNIPRLLVTAEYQTHGRGQYGRTWDSPRDANILASFAFPADAVTHTLLSLATGVCVCKVLRAHGCNADCKWPNDILCGQNKIAGILVERTPHHTILGMGINYADPLLPSQQRTSCIAQGVTTARDEILCAIAAELETHLTWTDAEIHAEYCTFWQGRGDEVFVGENKEKAVLDSIDLSGALVVRLPTGLRTIYSSSMIQYTI